MKPYLKSRKYALPLDYAYPVFGWGVKFEGDSFAGIVSEDTKPITAKETVRHERPTVTEILEVKQLVEQRLGKPANSNILYHLDRSQFTHYTEDEIAENRGVQCDLILDFRIRIKAHIMYFSLSFFIHSNLPILYSFR